MFVLGCHRSGTSLLAGIISDSLTNQGNRGLQEQLPAQVDNPGGFFESRQLVNLNEALLSKLGIDWQYPPLHAIQWQRSEFLPMLHAARENFTQQALNQSWIDKDPRLCLTYPAYQHILLRRTPIAAVIRHPFEVAGSLQSRDMIPLAKGLIIWFLYNQHLARSITHNDVLISYQSLINHEESAIISLSSFISKSIPEFSCTSQTVRSKLDLRAQKAWRRNDNQTPNSFLPDIEWTKIAKICIEIYEKIRKSGFTITQLQSCFSNTPDAILCGCAVLGWQKMPAIEQNLKGELESMRLELDQLKNSKSWKLTAPLRWIGDKVKP